MVYKFFDKKKGLGAHESKGLPKQLHKPVRFIWQEIERQIYLRGDHYLLLIVVLIIYCVWQIILPNMFGLRFWQIKKAKTVLYGFIGIVNESNRKPNKLSVDQRRAFYYKLI